MSLSVDKALRKAKKHMMAGEPTEAEELYKKVLSRFPKNRKAILGYQKLKAGITSQGASSSELPQEKVQELVDLYKQGQFDKVLAKVKHLTGLYPEVFIFHFLQGGSNAALQRYKAATQSYKNAVRIKPESFEANFNLGNALKGNGDLEAAISSFKEALKIKPDHVDTHLNLGNTFKDKGKLEAAVHSYQQVLKIKFDYAEAHLNMGNALKDWGKLEAAMHSYKQALKINSDFSAAYLNMGATLMEMGEPDRARELYKKAIEIKPSYAMAYWNLSGTAASVTEAITLVEKCLQLNNNNTLAKFTLAFLNFSQGDKEQLYNLLNSPLKKHAFARSFSWVLSLPEMPKLYFSRWQLFDAVAQEANCSRPFYEYGVWRGYAFGYLIKFFKKGYGFDTFEGIPEDWHNEKKGTYSAEGTVPNIDGGEFIVGKFEETLPGFFNVSRPMASVINFDADLYSSTICALNYSKPVIDAETVLIFDEFLMNPNWEEDEFKALEEFCLENKLSYRVIAVSFFTKQVAVRLIRKATF